MEAEIAEKSEDLQTLIKAHDILLTRCIEVRDNSKSKLTPFHEWAGTHALMNSLDVFIHNATRTVEELKALRDETPETPTLRIVRNDE